MTMIEVVTQDLTVQVFLEKQMKNLLQLNCFIFPFFFLFIYLFIYFFFYLFK